MKKETFANIINALEAQRKLNGRFSEAIKQAYVDAGECTDFRDAPSYDPPTSKLQDTILSALADEFVNENLSRESALDTINYYFYDLDIMGRTVTVEHSDGTSHKEDAYIEVDGTRLSLANPHTLYDTLVHMATTKPKGSTPIQPTDLNIYHTVLNTLMDAIYDTTGLMVTEDTNIASLDMDSLDYVETAMWVENKLGLNIEDLDFLDKCNTPKDAALVLINKYMGEIKHTM